MKKLVTLLAILVLLSACAPSMRPTLKVNPTAQPTATLVPTVSLIENTSTIEPITVVSTSTIQDKTVGLGLTRTDAARMYQLLEFSFTPGTNELNQEVFVGTISDALATVTLTGSDTNISSISVVVIVPKPPTKNQTSRTMVYLTTLLTVATNDWAEGINWLNASLNIMGESRTTYNDRDVVLIITPESNQTKVEFTIAAK